MPVAGRHTSWCRHVADSSSDTRRPESQEMRGYRGIKYTLFICCYIFWVVSAIFIAVGIYAKVAKEKDVVDTLTVDPALVLIVVGSVTFLITFLGCVGSLRNAPCLLNMFLGILVVVLLLQVSAGVVGHLFTDMVMERTELLMMKAIVGYRDDRDLDNVIDFIQKKFQCCGVDGYMDWARNIYFQCSDTNPSLEACGAPFSCCIHLHNQTVLNTMCGYGTQQLDEGSAAEDIYTTGCLQKIVSWAKNNLLLVGGLTAGLLLLEVCLISLAAAQVSWIKKVRRQMEEVSRRSRPLDRKDSLWFPAFANFDDDDEL